MDQIWNAETYLKTLLEPIAAECAYTVDNINDFKTKFLLDKVKFNENEHKILSVDVINMYSNVNVPRVVSYVLEKIYSQPRKYFKFKSETGGFLPVPTRKNFLLETFQKYSIFRSPIGVYKQKSGLGMGSSISACVANIFVNLMEQITVKDFFASGKLISYLRYAEDCIHIIRKNALRSFLKETFMIKD